MPILKKLAFAPLFIIIFSLLIYRLTLFLKSYDFIFSLSINNLVDLITLSGLISLSSFLFILFGTLASDFRIVLAIGIAGSLIPLIFVSPALATVLAGTIFVGLLLANLNLNNALKSYLTFRPEAILGPAIRNLSGFLILAFCLVYFFSTSKLTAQNGFQIPDSLINTALKLTSSTLPESPTSNLPKLQIPTQAQPPQNLTQDLIKQTVKDQIENFIKPYTSFIPAVLAILLFLTLQSLVSLLNLLIYPLIWITFLILEKTGFVKFEVEQRPVKKMVI